MKSSELKLKKLIKSILVEEGFGLVGKDGSEWSEDDVEIFEVVTDAYTIRIESNVETSEYSLIVDGSPAVTGSFSGAGVLDVNYENGEDETTLMNYIYNLLSTCGTKL